MDAELNGKVAIVTGAGRGIGRAICLAMSGQGISVVAVGRTEADLLSVADEAKSQGGNVMPVVCDVSDEQSVLDMFARVRDEFDSLDILINNAGIGIYGQVVDFTVADFDSVMNVNLRGAFLCCREAMKAMIPQAGGYIINISSVVGIKGYPNQGIYTASKHGMMGLTKTLAAEGQEHGVRASAILPGGVDTDMVAQARPDLDRSILIRPADIARTVLYMLSLSDCAHVDEIYIRRQTGKPF